jgi:hypothetical protein
MLILAILATLISSAGCNFCDRFCRKPAAAPCAQPMMYQGCQPIEACGLCSTGAMPGPTG